MSTTQRAHEYLNGQGPEALYQDGDSFRVWSGLVRQLLTELETAQHDRVLGLDVHQWVKVCDQRGEWLDNARAERNAAHGVIRKVAAAVEPHVGYQASERGALARKVARLVDPEGTFADSSWGTETDDRLLGGGNG